MGITVLEALDEAFGKAEELNAGKIPFVTIIHDKQTLCKINQICHKFFYQQGCIQKNYNVRIQP